MQIVIDIPEWKYKSICEGVEASKRCGVVGIDPDVHEAIYNGTPIKTVTNAEEAEEYQISCDYDKDLFVFGRHKEITIRVRNNATNGDMIKTMFPCGSYGTNGEWVHVLGVDGNGVLVFTRDWWNAKYNEESEDDR